MSIAKSINISVEILIELGFQMRDLGLVYKGFKVYSFIIDGWFEYEGSEFHNRRFGFEYERFKVLDQVLRFEVYRFRV